ncbi:MAG TPA: hypothetical protein VNG04_09365 [Candidatus Acidoferrum sp.]|nr:hypothetical protein [Candidatus Acidoferrum sp.]HXJ32340.1 hypothetical protein [Gemmatimonadales bacterium]
MKTLGVRFWLIVLFWVCLIISAELAVTTAHAESYSPTDVHNWISAYASKYATPDFPYADLVARSERVATCESDHFDVAVINDARRGPMGEVGVFQFVPGPHSIFWLTPSAAAGFDYWDSEANVAGAVWLISRGYGPRNWSCW